MASESSLHRKSTLVYLTYRDLLLKKFPKQFQFLNFYFSFFLEHMEELVDLLKGDISEDRLEDLRFGVKLGLRLAHYNPKKAAEIKNKVQELILKENIKILTGSKTPQIREFSGLAQIFLYPKTMPSLSEILAEESDEEDMEEKERGKGENQESRGIIEETDEEEEEDDVNVEIGYESETQMSFEDFQKFLALNS